MKRWFWKDRRLAWPIVAAVVASTLALTLIDLIWRQFVLSSETLLIMAAAIELGLLLLVAIVSLAFRHLKGSGFLGVRKT